MKKYFTLIELIVVIAIIAILAAIIAPNAFKAIEKAKISQAISDYRAIKTASLSVYADTGQWPDNSWGDTLFNMSGLFVNNGPGWDGPYLEKEPNPHPWGGFYYFESEEDLAKSPTEPANGIIESAIDFENYCYPSGPSTCGVPLTSVKKIDEIIDDGNTSWGDFRGSSGSSDTLWVLVWDAFTAP